MLAYFAPVKWAAAVANADKCTVFPYITLRMLDTIYCEGIAVRIVENNLRGLFSLARPREFIVDAAVKQAAGLMVGKFGAELPVFGMLLYFAQYLTDYKNSYSQFDLVDVLRQCGKVFLPRWRSMMGRRMEKTDAGQSCVCKERGKEALYTYLRREYVDKGIDVRTSPIVAHSSFSEEEIRFIESGEPLPLCMP